MNLSAEELDPLLSVAVATLSETGVLLTANAGFLRLLGEGSESRCGSVVSRFFLQPTFAAIWRANAGDHGETYQGLMTLGEQQGKVRTLRGRVWRTDEGIRLLAEYDIEELERVSETMEDLNRESLFSRRELGAANSALTQRMAVASKASLTDVLTGVGNRRMLDQALDREIARARRDGSPLSIIMADIDYFKGVNDLYGHAIGDQVLTHFGALLLQATRSTDTVARFGGEEFVVLMPNTGMASAAQIAERIRASLARERIAPVTDAITSSFGVAEYIADEGASAFLARADAALYGAKQAGRNRVVQTKGDQKPASH